MSLNNRQRQENIRFVKDHLWKGVVYRSNNFVLDCSPKKRWHEIGKFLDGCEMRNEGGTFYMEAEIVDPITKKRKRADTIYADFKRVIERQHDESDESIEEKRVFYTNLGFDFEVRKVINPIEEINKKLDKIKSDKRISYPPAAVQINTPLALIQVALETKRDILEEVLKLLEVK